MDFENCKDIFISEGEESDVIIKPRGKAAEFYFDCEKKKDKRYKLFVSGETGLFYMWRNEPDYPSLYHTLTDALCHKETMRAQYSLDVSRNTAENFEWRAYKKIMWPPVLSYLPLVPLGEKWKVGFWAKAENLAAEKGGKILMRVCVYGKKEGLSVHSLFQPLTENIEIPIEQGSYGWKKTEREITVPKDETAFVGVWFEGVGYTGKVYIERPFLVSDNGYNVLPDFSVAQPKKEKFAWAAQNLSRKEWPKFSVKLNGEEIFSGEKFERIHRNASWETDIPSDLLKEKNVLSVSLISDCYAATPYAIKEVRLIEQSGGDISVIAAPEYTSENAEFPVLIRTGKDGATVRAKSGKTYSFEEKGLHVIRLNARTDAEGGKFVLKCGNFEACGDVPVAAPKEDDGVITGTGDMIYVAQDESEVEEYLSWYFSNGLGNFLTIRPTYRWSSTREVNVKVWKKVKEILCGYGVKYVHMMDGRELPGYASNPSLETLSSDNFLGRQRHEIDGLVFYNVTGFIPYSDIFAWQILDMKTRIAMEKPENANTGSKADTREYGKGGAYANRLPDVPRDVKEGHDYAVKRIGDFLGDATRHTGPSVQFRTFSEAGFKWLGMETVYTTMEPHIAFLRGVKKAFGIPSFGVHNAIQWSTTPHDTEERFRRFRLSLYVAYLQGASDINTEEGLWRLEEYYAGFHRFTDACKGHIKQQKDFYRYVSSHSRTGEFYTPMALLQGKYDPWIGFINGRPYGWEVKYGDAENSWQLLKTFYPLSKPGQELYIHNCPPDRPSGYFTGTPDGNIDVIPVESGENLLEKYRVIAFIGYNFAERETFGKLEKYVLSGGKLILTRAHRTIATNYDDISSGNLKYDDTFALGFSVGKQRFVKDGYKGAEIQVCENAEEGAEILAVTDGGKPLVCRYKVGLGEVVLFNVNAYPAHPAIKELYAEILKKEQKAAAEKEDVWAVADENVEFAVYDQKDGAKHLYILAVDWYRDPSYERVCSVRIAGNEYKVKIPFGTMYKCVIRGGVGAYCTSEDGEVMRIMNGRISVRGRGKQRFIILSGGEATEKEIDFTLSPTAETEL